MSMAEKKKAERDAKKAETAIARVVKGASGKQSSWTRKSVAIDDEIVEAMEAVCQKERKLFSQLAREFFIAGLKDKGVTLD